MDSPSELPSKSQEVPDHVDPSEKLHRRLKPCQIDNVDGELVPLAAAFMGNPPLEISVDRAPYRSIEETLVGHEGFGVCCVSAKTAEDITGNRPIPDKRPNNPAHALIVVSKPNDAEPPYETYERLAEASVLVHDPSEESYKIFLARRKSKRVSGKARE